MIDLFKAGIRWHTGLQRRGLAVTYWFDHYQIKHISCDILKSHWRFITAEQEQQPQGAVHPLLIRYHSPFHLPFTLLPLIPKTGKVIHEMFGVRLFSPVIQNWNLHYSFAGLHNISTEYVVIWCYVVNAPQTNSAFLLFFLFLQFFKRHSRTKTLCSLQGAVVLQNCGWHCGHICNKHKGRPL